MVNHIYGKTNLLCDNSRGHVFINELTIYIKNFTEELKECTNNFSEKSAKKLEKYHANIMDGIEYYSKVADQLLHNAEDAKNKFINDLENLRNQLLSQKLPK